MTIPCDVSLFNVGAACRVTIDENREPKFLILSSVGLLFGDVSLLIASSEGISVTEMLIRR